MIKKESQIKKLNRYLGWIGITISLDNGSGYTDINKSMEDFLLVPLSYIYNADLINLNQIRRDYPAIDLGDKHKKLSIQVTSDGDNSKVQDTIEKFERHNLFNEFDKLIMVVLKDRKSNQRRKPPTTNGQYNFDSDSIIWLNDLSKLICENEDVLEKCIEYFDKHIDTRPAETEVLEFDIFRDIFQFIRAKAKNNSNQGSNGEVNYDSENIRIKAARFKVHWNTISDIYSSILSGSQELAYAKALAEFDESDQEIVRRYLRVESIKLLNSSNNPIAAIGHLKDTIIRECGPSLIASSDVEGFLYFELLNCDVFPNIIKRESDDRLLF